MLREIAEGIDGGRVCLEAYLKSVFAREAIESARGEVGHERSDHGGREGSQRRPRESLKRGDKGLLVLAHGKRIPEPISYRPATDLRPRVALRRS
jgi:hypothetical protein